MKLYFLIGFLVLPFFALSQIDKIRYSKLQLINSMNNEPCKSSYDESWYCGENGSLINYKFKNNFVSSVLYMWEFNSKHEADQDVTKEIEKAKITYGRPEMKGNEVFWFKGSLLIHVTYGYTNGKHYSCWSVSEI